MRLSHFGSDLTLYIDEIYFRSDCLSDGIEADEVIDRTNTNNNNYNNTNSSGRGGCEASCSDLEMEREGKEPYRLFKTRLYQDSILEVQLWARESTPTPISTKLWSK